MNYQYQCLDNVRLETLEVLVSSLPPNQLLLFELKSLEVFQHNQNDQSKTDASLHDKHHLFVAILEIYQGRLKRKEN